MSVVGEYRKQRSMKKRRQPAGECMNNETRFREDGCSHRSIFADANRKLRTPGPGSYHADVGTRNPLAKHSYNVTVGHDPRFSPAMHGKRVLLEQERAREARDGQSKPGAAEVMQQLCESPQRVGTAVRWPSNVTNEQFKALRERWQAGAKLNIGILNTV